MPDINLRLTTSKPIGPTTLRFNDSLLAPKPTFTKKQLAALKCIFCNVAHYGKKPLLFSLRNQRNVPRQYNPHGVGHKPLIAVINKLRRNGLLELEKGTPWYTKDEDGEYLEGKLSSFVATDALEQLVASLGIEKEAIEEVPQVHVVLRDRNNRMLEYQPTPFTQHIERLMAEYCDYLNRQHITIDDERIEDLHLQRKFKDWKENPKSYHLRKHRKKR